MALNVFLKNQYVFTWNTFKTVKKPQNSHSLMRAYFILILYIKFFTFIIFLNYEKFYMQ